MENASITTIRHIIEHSHQPARDRIVPALQKAEEVTCCVACKIGDCASCPVAVLALDLLRWGGQSEKEAISLVRPLCHEMTGTPIAIQSLKKLRNPHASLSMGQIPQERWE